jgi:hypothetical protein
MSRAIVVPTGTGDVQAATGDVDLYGFSARESAGTAAVATVVIRDGTSAAGTPVAFIELAANGSVTTPLPDVGVRNGLFVDRIAGETELVLYVGGADSS